MSNINTKAKAKNSTATASAPDALSWTFGSGDKAKAFTIGLKGLGIDHNPVTFYLLQNGFKQSMADSIAGYKKELEAEGEGMGDDFTRKYTDDQVHALMIEALTERYDAILKGEVGFGAMGPRLRGVDKIMRDIAVTTLNNAYAANKTLTKPKGEAWLSLVTAYVTKNDAKLRAEAESQMALIATGDDISALLEGLTKGDENKTIAA